MCIAPPHGKHGKQKHGPSPCNQRLDTTCSLVALERLRQLGAELVYRCPKPQSGGKQADLVLTPLEVVERIAALVPSPRRYDHRLCGVLAPNSPLRAVVTAMAQAVRESPRQAGHRCGLSPISDPPKASMKAAPPSAVPPRIGTHPQVAARPMAGSYRYWAAPEPHWQPTGTSWWLWMPAPRKSGPEGLP
jgi:hypothetical protein